MSAQIIGPVVVSGVTMRINQSGKVQYQRHDGEWCSSSKAAEEVIACAGEKQKLDARELRQAIIERKKPRKKRRDRLRSGTVYQSKSCGPFTVVYDRGATDVLVRFPSGYECHTYRAVVRRGTIRDRLRPSVYGVGYLGGVEHTTMKRAYQSWREMMRRCYGPDRGRKGSVCEEWHNYQTFADWYCSHSLGERMFMRVMLTEGTEYSPSTSELRKTHSRETKCATNAKNTTNGLQ